MGIKFSINLYFPLNKLGCAIDELVKLTEGSTEKRMSIRLADGQKIVVPHTMEIVPDKLNRSLNEEVTQISFHTSFLLAEDRVIRAYTDEIYMQRRQTPQTGPHHIGNLAIMISIGTQYAEIGIMSVSSSQNRILAESEVMHQHIAHILRQCDGLFALLDTETSDKGQYLRRLINNPDQVVAIDVEASDYGDDIDYIVKTVQQQIGTKTETAGAVSDQSFNLLT